MVLPSAPTLPLRSPRTQIGSLCPDELGETEKMSAGRRITLTVSVIAQQELAMHCLRRVSDAARVRRLDTAVLTRLYNRHREPSVLDDADADASRSSVMLPPTRLAREDTNHVRSSSNTLIGNGPTADPYMAQRAICCGGSAADAKSTWHDTVTKFRPTHLPKLCALFVLDQG